VQEELSVQAKWFPLQDEVDEGNSLVRLLSGPARGDLVCVELEIQPADGDGFHAMVKAAGCLLDGFVLGVAPFPLVKGCPGPTFEWNYFMNERMLKLVRSDRPARVCWAAWFCAMALTIPALSGQTVGYSSGVGEVVKMLDAKVDSGVIKTYIENAPVAYRPSAEEIIALHQRGVPSDIVAAMLRRGGEVRAQAAPAQPIAPTAVAPVPATYAVAPAVNYVAPVQTVYPAYSDVDAYPSYAVYPSSSYVSLGVGCGWPYYWAGCGWPGYGYHYGGAWGGSRYGGSFHYSAPSYSGFGGHAGFASAHSSGSFHAGSGGGGSSHRGR